MSCSSSVSVNLVPSLVSRLPATLELLPRLTVSLSHHLQDTPSFFSELLNQVVDALKACRACLFLSGEGERWQYCLGRQADGTDLPEEQFLNEEGQRCLARARIGEQAVILEQWLASPLLIERQCVGVLCLYREQGRLPFTSGEGQLVDCVSRQAGVALVQARLRKQVAELEQQAQLERQAREKAQQQLQCLQHHAMLTVHELQAPVRSLAGMAQTVLKLPDDLQAREACLEGIAQGSQRLSELLRNLLDYCRAERCPLRTQRISSATVFTQVCQQLEEPLRLTQAELTRTALPWLEADPVALGAILRALIVNALQFSRGRPHIHVDCREGVFRVVDQGIGIPAEQRQRVFEPFYRVNPLDSKSGQGLGLSVCRLLVERHGGRIWLEERADGPGLSVCFSLGGGES